MNFLFRSVQFGLMHIWPALVLFFCAAFLPASVLGTAAVFLSVATLFRPLVGLSLGRTSIRSAGEAFATGGRGEAERVLNLATRLGFLASLLGLAGAAVAVPLVQRVYGLEVSATTIAAGVIFIYAFGITELLDGLLRAQGGFRPLAGAVVVSRILGVALLLGLLPLVPRLDVLFLILAVSELLCIALLHRNFIPAFREQARITIFSGQSLRMLRECAPVVVNALSVYLYARAMVMVAGLHDSGANLGGFEMAVQLTNLPMAITIVCASVMSPVVARLYAQGPAGRNRVEAVVSYAASFSVWVNMVAATYLMLVGPFVLRWLFPEIEAAPLILAIIAPLVALKAYAQILSGELSIATGTASTAARITIVFAFVTVSLGFILSKMDGVRGAAWAMLIAHSMAVAATVLVLSKRMGLKLRYRTGSSLAFALCCAAPSALVICWFRTEPGMAALAGSLCFFAIALLTLVVSFKCNLPLHQPLLDGWRMVKSKGIGQTEEFLDLSEHVADLGHSSSALRAGLLQLIKDRSPSGHAFWFDGQGSAEDVPLQDHADIVYSTYLLGEASRLHPKAVAAFFVHVGQLPLYGKKKGGVNAHLTAYLLGAIRLLEASGMPGNSESLYKGWRKDLLLDSRGLPRWPRAWTHHIWRVSHWIGGAPSILLQLAESGKVGWATHALVEETLALCEKNILDPSTGLLRPYRNQLLQNIFRKLYRLRHDPDIADLGGVVHLLWVFHACGRPYAATASLAGAADHQLKRAPFMEDMPYCLDFDILQLRRTALDVDTSTRARGRRFIEDSLAFFRQPISSRFTLHKLPGALASMHEAAFLADEGYVAGLSVQRVDIIRTAYWL